MIFEPTINAGNLIMISMVAVAIIGGWYKFGGRLDIIEYRVKAIEDTLKTLSEVLKSIASTDKQLAVIDQRQLAIEGTLSTLGQEISDLRRGNGWIQSPHRANIDGEYPHPLKK